MASSKICIVIAIAAVFAPSILATEFMIGDETGWTTNFDYQAWAYGKEFHVGDKLVFRYPPGVHNVVRVNGTGFEKCEAPAGTEALTTGEDTLTLTSPGKKWYICSMGNHCKSGNMRLTITVLAELGSPTASPSPSPVSAAVATGSTGLSGCGGWIAVAIPCHTSLLLQKTDLFIGQGVKENRALWCFAKYSLVPTHGFE